MVQNSIRMARRPCLQVRTSATAGSSAAQTIGILMVMAMAVPAFFAEMCFFGASAPRARPALRATVASQPPSTRLDAAEVSPLLKFAGSAMGALKPIFAAQAKAQASEYDAAEVRAQLEAEIKSAPVVIYTYSLSPFSSEAKKILDELGADYREIELGQEWFMLSEQAAAKRAELGAMFGQTSLPHIFIGGRSIGGLADGTPGLAPLLDNGELKASLEQAGAMPDEGLFGFFLYSGDTKKR
mmetsp:Transcript_94218/g.236421  ORF Transcript_94218/g.236421 Transcript_94218/m.236421 type:complete len:241 (+) Transcript_94218:107-829(+)